MVVSNVSAHLDHVQQHIWRAENVSWQLALFSCSVQTWGCSCLSLLICQRDFEVTDLSKIWMCQRAMSSSPELRWSCGWWFFSAWIYLTAEKHFLPCSTHTFEARGWAWCYGKSLTNLSYAGNILFSFVFKSPVSEVFSAFQCLLTVLPAVMNTQLCYPKVTNSVLGCPC